MVPAGMMPMPMAIPIPMPMPTPAPTSTGAAHLLLLLRQGEPAPPSSAHRATEGSPTLIGADFSLLSADF
jgi:hypothetical protein